MAKGAPRTTRSVSRKSTLLGGVAAAAGQTTGAKSTTTKLAGSRRASFELFGLDFMVDDALGVWLIEVNENPFLGAQNTWHASLVEGMVDRMMSLAVDPHLPPCVDARGAPRAPRVEAVVDAGERVRKMSGGVFQRIFSAAEEIALSEAQDVPHSLSPRRQKVKTNLTNRDFTRAENVAARLAAEARGEATPLSDAHRPDLNSHPDSARQVESSTDTAVDAMKVCFIYRYILNEFC